jgi:hypothetical protein
LLVCTASVRDAFAGDVETARKTFAEGVRLYQRGDWEGARRLFQRADAEHHAPAIVYNLALAEEKLGHLQAAVDAYEAYVGEVGEKGELSSSAVVAVAQIKARSTRLRVETTPAGARIFVDGAPTSEPSPTTYLVGSGRHVVIAQGDGWREERDVQARGAADAMTVSLAKKTPDVAEAPPAARPAPSSLPAEERDRPPPIAPAAPLPAPDGLVWGAEFAIVPAYLFPVTRSEKDNAASAASIIAGPVIEIGWALTEQFAFLARGFAGIGPDAKPSYAYMGGPGLSFRVANALWLGASFIGGKFETESKSAQSEDTVRYGTDLVFGAMAEANVILIKKPFGEWIAGFQPAFLLTKASNDNTTLFFPLSFGFRAY